MQQIVQKESQKAVKTIYAINEWEQAHKEFKKKKRTSTGSIMYLNEWKHFCRQCLLLLYVLISRCFSLLSTFLSYKPFRNNKMLYEIIDCYISIFYWWNTTEKRRLEKLFLEASVWVPKPGYRSPKRSGYVTAFTEKSNLKTYF